MCAAGSGDERPPSFFISYARDDAWYVEKLVAHLRRSGLPVWFDHDLPWGSEFPREIPRQIRHSLAVVVVMSPAAAESRWVYPEILEGQRYDRPFLPILLRDRPLFLLAASNYFDARDGALPGEREIGQLQAIRDKGLAGAGAGAGPPPPLVLPRPAHPVSAAGTSHDALPMAVALGELHAALEKGRVEHADILTTALVLEAAGRLDYGYLHPDHGQRLPFSVLDQIDASWSTLSPGTQGFRAQVARHPGVLRDGSEFSRRDHDFRALAVSLGWLRSPDEVTEPYGGFVRPAVDHPGFFPTLRNPQTETHGDWYGRWRSTVIAVHIRLRRWRGRR